MKNTLPVVKDLVLVGGGHAHVTVLKKFGMHPLPGLRITLIARDIHTPYSGMLPGHIAGFYDYDDCHIDLGKLARFAGARLIHAEVEAIDPDAQTVSMPGRPALPYDLLSINTGSRPGAVDVPGAREHALAVKPIDLFLRGWDRLRQRVLDSAGDFRIVVVGGGAGGVELALSTQYRLNSELQAMGNTRVKLDYTLVTESDGIMANHNAGVQRIFNRVFAERKIELLSGRRVIQVDADRVLLDDGHALDADAVLWVTTASTPAWPGDGGLMVDAQGFIRVDRFLRSRSHANVFAAGDVASLADPRPKSGVFAVRQGPVLADNLRAAATGRSLRAYCAQKHFLGLISTGDRYAVASRGRWAFESAWLWTIKDWIDVNFMRKFNELPAMPEPQQPIIEAGLADAETRRVLSHQGMRCGGCGAKVGSSVLSRVMQRLPVMQRDDVLIGREQADDSALLKVPANRLLVQSVDYFRAFIDDAYVFGAIAANHALGDLYAMGAQAQSALAVATVPYAREAVVEQTLYELLSGALSQLEAAGAVLAGGHSSEGLELAFGLTVNGLVEESAVLRKGGLRDNDVLILTKALGTGTLMAADMRGKARGRWVERALEGMLQSSRDAALCLSRYDVRACTDVTGFGLVGHLYEMLKASALDAEIDIQRLPLLEGAVDTAAAGILSSLQPENLRQLNVLANHADFAGHAGLPLLFDPQTAGGLLFGVAGEHAEACVDALRQLGYADATVIGRCRGLAQAMPLISLA